MRCSLQAAAYFLLPHRRRRVRDRQTIYDMADVCERTGAPVVFLHSSTVMMRKGLIATVFFNRLLD